MKHRYTASLPRFAPRLLALLLCAALLAGCSAAPRETEAPASGADVSIDVSETYPPDTSPTEAAGQSGPALAEDGFAILFVNVGKADAAILRFGDTAVLIDTGTAESVPRLIAGFNALDISQIDAVFITHSHSDHLGGLAALSANYAIPVVYSPYYAETDKNGVGKIVKRAEKLGLAHQELKAGDTVAITDSVSFSVIGPLLLNEDDDNDNSLVLQFTYGGHTFLFTGDMQFPEEQTLIDAGVFLKSDVLKVGNHGNPDATGDDFGALVSPALAVISTDTAVDTDSANPRVYAALQSAKIVVTQDYPIGVLLTLDRAGALSLSSPARSMDAARISVSSLDVQTQTVTLTNDGGERADLSGYTLFCARSDAALRFPEGTTLDAGESLVVGGASLPFPGEEKPLSKKKTNTVSLFDRLGSLISKLEQ